MQAMSLLRVGAAAILLAPSVSAQRIWTLTGLPGVLEENATTGELLSAYPLPAPFVPFLAPLGDLSVDRATGTLWVTDGMTVGRIARTGGPPIEAYPVPLPLGPLTGMAYDTTAGFPNLWLTDGVMIGNYGLGPAGLFPLAPAFFGPFPGMTGIDYDSSTGTLWVVDGAGFTSNLGLPGGAILGIFPPPVGAFGPPFSGIAVDTTLPGGPLVARAWLLAVGGVVNLATGAVATAYTFVGSTHEGIGWGPVANRYGAGAPGPAGFLPEIDSTGGMATVGNGTYSITISNAVPGPSFLLLSPLAAAIPLAFFGLGAGELLVDPTVMTVLPETAVGPGPGFAGTISVLPLPPFPALAGATLFAQWANFDGVLFGFSRGLTFTIGTI